MRFDVWIVLLLYGTYVSLCTVLYTAVHVKDKAYLILSFNIKLGKKNDTDL